MDESPEKMETIEEVVEDDEVVDLCIKLDYQGNLNKDVFTEFLVVLVNYSIFV